ADAVPPAEPVDEREVLLACLLDGLGDRAVARGVYAQRLFGKDVLVLFDRVLEVDPAEGGGRSQEDAVDAGVDDLLVRVQTSVLVALIHLDLLGVALAVAGQGVVDLVLPEVADGGDVVGGVGGEGLPTRAGAAAAAANEAELHDVRALRV